MHQCRSFIRRACVVAATFAFFFLILEWPQNGFSLDWGFEGDGRRLSGRPHLQSANPSSAIMIRIKVSGADKAPKSAKTRSQICIAKKLSALDIQSSAKLDAQGCVNAAGKLRQIW